MGDVQQQIADGARPLARAGDVIEHGQDIPANVVRLIGHDRAFTPPVERAVVRVIEGADMCYWTGGHMEAWNEDEIPAKWFPLTVVEVAPEPQPANSLRCPTCDSAARLSQPAAAESGPLVLTLPEVPAEAVALIGGSSGATYPKVGAAWGFDQSETGVIALGELLDREDTVTVEFAPPREPRTWPKIDGWPTDLPDQLDLHDADDGHVSRWTFDDGRGLYGDGIGSWLSFVELRQMGEVREVLDGR